MRRDRLLLPVAAACRRCGRLASAIALDYDYCWPSPAWLASHPLDVGASAHAADATLTTPAARLADRERRGAYATSRL